jgi:hypothetical protein
MTQGLIAQTDSLSRRVLLKASRMGEFCALRLLSAKFNLAAFAAE